MSVLLLVLWAGGLVALPGRLLAELVLRADSLRSRAETWSFSFAFGIGWLTSLSAALRFANALTLPWVVGATFALVGAIGWRVRTTGRSEHGLRPAGIHFWAAILLTLAGLGLALLPLRNNAFGADTYFWTEAAVRLVSGGPIEGRPFWEVYPLFTESPTGYGYLLATAALLTPELDRGEVILFFALLWTGFAFGSAFALGEHLAGRAWGAASALVYLGSYWMLYYLVTSVSRQSLGVGLAPLFFLLLAKKGADVVREPSLYALLGTTFVLHAFTGFFLLSTLPAVLVVESIREGLARRRASWGAWGTLAAAALSAAPLVVFGRFLGDLTGVVPLSDAPFKYRLELADPLEPIRTIGALTLASLALGSVFLWRERREIPLVASSVSLLALTLLIGVFPQSWYQASYLALPAHRYYIFYSLVALVWLGLAGPLLEKWLPPKSRFGVGVLALAQIGFSAFFALRMNEPRPRLQTVLEASRWVEDRSSREDAVALILSRLENGAAIARAVLAPRPVLVLEWKGEATLVEARRLGARYLITDSGFLEREGISPTARFELEPETAVVFRIEE